ncbi:MULTISPECIES: SDR family NAD(P)-dependent oxidoreductase [Pseudomonas]|uniref:SDR family NAD(P)-dependent oxidoreductase n=1 Tax=Pseudomonas TaxID=286 RepID=UPI0008766D75|nr:MULTISPECIES: SDR family oxidoreductase [Pseudomonas]MDB6442628.1 SDR family NAD(P)-dependent oxidoreductase [Pseudomonas sp. 21TX0197]NHN68305.1 SDR family oxidoreductase [Pseudomonas fluorescens]ROO39689.1 short-chain dehydrogenase [Pseudomonas sp. AF76]ROO40058.1 short-chain dehydrogenase [Pseudomonas sp. 7SR1]SCX66124.1 Enoyl-(Acyl carrier protein) reductase [Pseudomonas sp. NFACC32-1]
MYIVTGGTQGIGAATVEKLASLGHPVVFTGRDPSAGSQLAERLPDCTFVPGDVLNEDDCRHVVATALQLGDGKLAGLVNNAGMSGRKTFTDTTQQEWDLLFAVNTRSVFFYTKHALPGLIAGRGAVVNVSSIAGKTGEQGLATYCASKAALLGLTQALALEYGGQVRFNAVCPGQIATRMMDAIVNDEKRLAALTARIPEGRLASAAEVAQAICWLLSPESSYVNGTTLTVDGGETAGLLTPRS